MRGFRRASRLCSLLLFPNLVYVQAVFAQTPKPTTSTQYVADSDRAAFISPEVEGDIFIVRGSYSAAIRAYQRETNRSAALWNKLGSAYHHLYAFDKARDCYQQALAIDPHFPYALNNLASVYYNQNNFAKAERLYKQAIEYKPDQPAFYGNLGATYFADNKYKLGVEAYHKGLALNPNLLRRDPTQMVGSGIQPKQALVSNFYLAKVCATAGKMQESLDYLRKALGAGFSDQKQLMKANEFSALRSTPEFQKLLAQYHVGK